MSLILFMSFFIVVGGLILVFSSSPSFSIFGVVLQAISLSSFIGFLGYHFLCLLLILIYVGGMLIVFLFSTVLSAEPHPQGGFSEALLFGVGIVIVIIPFINIWIPVNGTLLLFSFQTEIGVGEIFNFLFPLIILVALVLLIALMIVLILGYEHNRGNLRKL